MHTGANHCDYGVLPGYLSFNVMKPVGERWQVRLAGFLQLTHHPAADPTHWTGFHLLYLATHLCVQPLLRVEPTLLSLPLSCWLLLSVILA